MKEIVIIGAGDFGKEVAWLIEDINSKNPEYIILGFLDDTPEKQNTSVNGYNVLGEINTLPEINEQHNACAVIAIQNSEGREKIVRMFPDFAKWETLIHPNVNISRTSDVGEGTIICAGVNISVNASVGSHCILNMGTIVENDCKICDYSSVMCRTVIGSHSILGEHSYLGSNSTVTARRNIGRNSQVGPGSVVISDVQDDITVIGVPAKKGILTGNKYSYL